MKKELRYLSIGSIGLAIAPLISQSSHANPQPLFVIDGSDSLDVFRDPSEVSLQPAIALTPLIQQVAQPEVDLRPGITDAIAPMENSADPEPSVTQESLPSLSTAIDASQTAPTLSPQSQMAIAPPDLIDPAPENLGSAADLQLSQAEFQVQDYAAHNDELAQVNQEVEITIEVREDLRIPPRIGLGHTSSGAGHDGTTRIEGFLPINQNPGEDMFFSEGRLMLDNDANLGGNLVMGYRTYDENSDRTFGGYVAYDSRTTGDSTFHQVGFGAETLGEVWDLRVNGYLPFGDRLQQVNPEGEYVDLFFADQSLVLLERREIEAAMTGLDAETGIRLAQFGNDGDLRGYGGLYWYEADGSPSTLGWRVRLEARPNDELSLGVAVQDDDLFGTNVVLNVAASLPGRNPSGLNDANDSAVARLGEFVGRNPHIVVDYQEKFEEQVATNPDTGQPYVFQHVELGNANGNGSFESPFGTVEPALAATRSNGNHIVYVQSGDNSEIPGFQIPAQVSVLSTGPRNFVNTREAGILPIPLSGSGEFPVVIDTVQMGESSVLSGFDIQATTGPGVLARDINDATIATNRISSTTTAAVLLQDTTGTISLLDNEITGNGVPALIVQDVNDVVANGSFTSENSDQSGLMLSDVFGTVELAGVDLTVMNPTEHGLAIENVSGTVRIDAEQSAIATQNDDQAGIFLQDNTGNIELSGLQVNSENGAALQSLNLQDLQLVESQLSSLNSGTDGISFFNVTGTATLSDVEFMLTNPADNGIFLDRITGTTTLDAAPGSIITNPGNQDILIQNSPGNTSVTGF